MSKLIERLEQRLTPQTCDRCDKPMDPEDEHESRHALCWQCMYDFAGCDGEKQITVV
jgi:hypothetical protein